MNIVNKSTMQRLQAENERLYRANKVDRLIYWVCLAAVAVVAAMEYAL